MQSLSLRHGIIAAAALLGMSFGVSYGQEAPTFHGQRTAAQPLASAVNTAALPAQSTTQTYLPLMVAGYGPIAFSTSVDANGAPVSPAASFSYGIKDLFFSALVGGMNGVSYKIVVTAPDGNQLSETFPSNTARYYAGFQICLVSGGSCDTGTKSALPRGSYKAQLYANDVLVREDSTTIQ